MNVNELVASIEVELEAAETRETRARKEIELILAGAQQESRSNLSEDEDATCERLFETIELAQSQQESIKRKLARATKVQAEEKDFEARMANATTPANLPKRDDSGRTASHSVGNEPHTYSKETDPTGQLFLGDVLRQFVSNDVRSADRLQRHMREETVDRSQKGYELRTSNGVGTGAFSGLVVPQYLIDMVAPHIANLRPFADVCNTHPLPASGMSVNISRITTSSSAAAQVTELDTVSFTDMDDTLLTIPVNTAAGQQVVSRQAIERGTGIEDIVLQDLFRQYATSLDATLISGATTGLQTVAHSNTVTTTDLQTFFTAVMGAMSQSESATLGMAHPTHLLLHPRRWYYLQSLLTSTWPALAAANVPPRSLGTDNEAAYNEGIQGVFPGGMGVVMDANIPTTVNTTQDVAFIVPNVECHLWEEGGNPTYIRAEQPKAGNLGVLMVVYGYFAYTFQRYANATQMLTGAALGAPAGF